MLLFTIFAINFYLFLWLFYVNNFINENINVMDTYNCGFKCMNM